MKPALVLLAAACLVSGCHKKTPETPSPPEDAATSAAPPPAPPPPAAADSGTQVQGGPLAAQEACVDQWLQEHHLDRFGRPEGTMYAGGTPLFNEATGQSQPRLPYVFKQQPDALAACPSPSTP